MSNTVDQSQVRLDIPADLEYLYRDFFTVYAGPDDVVLEFGNQHRSQPNTVKIGNRIVLTPANALRLRELLDRTIVEMQRRMAQGRPGQEPVGGH